MKKVNKRKNAGIYLLLLFIFILVCCILIIFFMCKLADRKHLNNENSLSSTSLSYNVNDFSSDETSLDKKISSDTKNIIDRERFVGDWNLILVNPWNKMPDEYTMETTELRNGNAVDSRAYPDLQQMMDDCRAAGLSPLICSSYRTQEKQQRLFDNQVASWLNKGYSQEEAEKKPVLLWQSPELASIKPVWL